MQYRPFRLGIFFVLLLSVIGSAESQATRFRGPNGQGIYMNETAPTNWTEEDFAWSIDLPGSGHSSPVIWGEKVFAVAADAEKYVYHILAVDMSSGKVLWQKDFPFAE